MTSQYTEKDKQNFINLFAEYHSRLNQLACETQHENKDAIIEDLKKINEYYLLSIEKSQPEQWGSIEEEYQTLIESIDQVKNNSNAARAASQHIAKAYDARLSSVLLNNIAQFLQVIFWTGVAATCCSLIIGVGLPLLATDALGGFFVSASLCLAIYTAMKNTIECLGDFRSLKRHDVAYHSQNELVSFFKTHAQSTPLDITSNIEQEPPVEEPLIQEMTQLFVPLYNI